MDRALDDVVRERSEQKRGSGSNNGGNGGKSRRRTDRRGGVRKTGNPKVYSDSLAWVHDKYEGDASGGGVLKRGGSADARLASQTSYVPPGAGKLKVENIHYELGHEELLGLFERQGPVQKLDLIYDRAGRSEGIAFVIYEREEDAKRAVQEFDGANANGQPIRLTFIKPPTAGSKSLFDRIKAPSEERSTSEPMRRGTSGTRRELKNSPGPDTRRDPTRRPTPPGIDRYVPPERRRERRSADEPIRGGERNRNGGRNGGGGNGGGGGGGGGGGASNGGGGGRRGENRGENRGSGAGRSRKTVEELDEEMNNYFAEAGAEVAPMAAPDAVVAEAVAAAAAAEEDEEMIL